MELHLNTYGSAIRKKDDMFEIWVDEKKVKISPQKLTGIIIANAVQISSDAIQLAMEHNIDVVMLDQYGNPYARVWFPKIGSTVLIRRSQLEMLKNPMGVDFIKRWICLKIMNQYRFSKLLISKRDWVPEDLKAKQESIRSFAVSIYNSPGSLDELGPTFMGLEGNASRIYFSILSELIPEAYSFRGRSSRPAKDAFNAFLNYAYGFLYSKTERALVIAGLDPYIGLLHSDNYNKKSFVFDFIEAYRILADEPVFYIFSRQKCKPEYLEPVFDGLRLSTEGKKFFALYFLEYLDTIIRYRNKNRKRIDMIQTDAHAFANYAIGKKDEYLESSIFRKLKNFINPDIKYIDEDSEC
ncbi:MAG: CRISPR-associated endonuclease Cas1 [Candidatus Cloacimonetes bacterium]|nr:CRISPR-associated endonuclease Cas1 [Candidatus Cloacimonadota bacterium]MDD3578081.1 CRISPR-associated endonuclease Cas1 [Candidatus Cloacimonadota bacterium]